MTGKMRFFDDYPTKDGFYMAVNWKGGMGLCEFRDGTWYSKLGTGSEETVDFDRHRMWFDEMSVDRNSNA